MRILRITLSVIVSLAGLSACVPHKDREQAQKGVEQFHNDFNRKAFGEIYERSDPSVRTTISKEDFVDGLSAMRDGHGAVLSTETIATEYNYEAGVSTVKLVLKVNFEKGIANEEFTFVIQDDGPRLKGYKFR